VSGRSVRRVAVYAVLVMQRGAEALAKRPVSVLQAQYSEARIQSPFTTPLVLTPVFGLLSF